LGGGAKTTTGGNIETEGDLNTGRRPKDVLTGKRDQKMPHEEQSKISPRRLVERKGCSVGTQKSLI